MKGLAFLNSETSKNIYFVFKYTNAKILPGVIHGWSLGVFLCMWIKNFHGIKGFDIPEISEKNHFCSYHL
jgi:hypothetical protein